MTCGHLGMEPHTSFLPTTATTTSSQSDELTAHFKSSNQAEGMKGFTPFCGFSYFFSPRVRMGLHKDTSKQDFWHHPWDENFRELQFMPGTMLWNCRVSSWTRNLLLNVFQGLFLPRWLVNNHSQLSIIALLDGLWWFWGIAVLWSYALSLMEAEFNTRLVAFRLWFLNLPWGKLFLIWPFFTWQLFHQPWCPSG